jgi:hypothetical protein
MPTGNLAAFVPQGFAVPEGLSHAEFRLRMLAASDCEKDYDAVMASQERLRAGSPHGWPREGFTLEENLEDLVRHEQEFHDRIAFAYTMLHPDESEVLGCVYINPPEPGDDHDARVYMWVRDEHHPRLTGMLRDAVEAWLKRDWPFSRIRYIRTEYLEVAAGEQTSRQVDA